MGNLARRAAAKVTWERAWELVMSIGFGDAYFVARALTDGVPDPSRPEPEGGA